MGGYGNLNWNQRFTGSFVSESFCKMISKSEVRSQKSEEVLASCFRLPTSGFRLQTD